MSSEQESHESLLAAIFEDFTDRCHRGEPVDVDVYANRHPELASILKQLLPTVQALVDHARVPLQSEKLHCGEADRRPSVMSSEDADAIVTLDSPLDSQSLADPMIGEDWHEYRILKRLGHGGMGVVYQARHHRLDRVVALKLLQDRLSDHSEHSARFHAEARSIARIDHPHIVQIYEVGEHQGRAFLALEYCEGGSLAANVATRAPTPAWVATVVFQVAGAVHAAHEAGVIHRDVKPANILLTADQTPKLVDFGLAKQLDVRHDQTVTGMILGTPSYMAPEQTLGDSRQITKAVDVYALGAVLYELLVGRPPFRSPSVLETLNQVRYAEVVAPKQLQPGVSRDLETICLKCLQKEPASRYLSAMELADDLKRFLDGRPIIARPVSLLERSARWSRRNSLVSVLMAGIFLSLLGGMIGMTLLLREARTRAVQAKQSEAAALEHQQQAVRERDEKHRQLYEARISEVRALRSSGKLGQRFLSYERLNEAATIAVEQQFFEEVKENLRTEAIACLAVAVDARRRPDQPEIPARIPNRIAVLTADDRLQYYAGYSGQAGQVIVCRVSDGAEVFRTPKTTHAADQQRHTQLSRDGRRLLVVDTRPPSDVFQSNCQVWDCESGQLLFDAPWLVPQHLRVAAAAFSPDGQSVALVRSATNSIHVFDLRSGTELSSFPCAERPLELSWSADGQQIACAGHGNTDNVCVYHVETGQRRRVWSLSFGTLDVERRLCWHPSSQFLAILNLGGRADAGIFEVETGTQISRMANPSSMLLEAGFTDSGDVFYTRTNQRLARMWDPWTGRQLLEIHQVRLIRGEHGFLRIGRENQMELWDLAVSSVLRTLPPQQVDQARQSATWTIPAPQISSSSQFLFCDSGDAATRVWDLKRNAAAGTIHRDEMSNKLHGTVLHTTRDEILLTNSRKGVTAWDTNWVTGELMNPRTYLADACSNGMAVSRDGSVFISRDARGQWIIVQPEVPDQPRHTLETNGFATLGYGDRMALSNNGRWAAFGYAVSTFGSAVQVHDTQTGEKLTELKLGGQLAFDPLDRWLIFMNTGTMHFVSTDSWKVVREIHSPFPSFVPKQLSFCADGTIMALDVGPGQMQLRDAETNQILADLIAPGTEPSVSRLSPDGTRLVAVGEQVQVWDLSQLRGELRELRLDWDAPSIVSGTELTSQPAQFRLAPSLQSLEHKSEAMAFSPDGQHLAVVTTNRIDIYDTYSGRHIRRLTDTGGNLYDITISPDGKWIAAGCGKGDFSVRIWETQTGELRHILRGNSAAVYQVKYNRSGSMIGSTGADGIVRLWSPETGELLHTISDPEHKLTEGLAFHPGGRLILVSGGGVIQLREGEHFQKVRRVLGSVQAWGRAEFSPDGQLLATGDHQHTVIWRVGEEDVPVARLDGAPCSFVRFARNGTILITASRRVHADESRRVIQFWNVGQWDEPSTTCELGPADTIAHYAYRESEQTLAWNSAKEPSIQFMEVPVRSSLAVQPEPVNPGATAVPD